MSRPVSITKRIEFDAGHRIPNHNSKCSNIHGHRYALEATVSGPLVSIPGHTSQGMVLDFSDLKRVMMEQVHDVWDHGFIVWEEDRTLISVLEALGPKHKTCIVQLVPTVENLVQMAYQRLDSTYRGIYGSGLALVKVRLYETPTSWAEVLQEGVM